MANNKKAVCKIFWTLGDKMDLYFFVYVRIVSDAMNSIVMGFAIICIMDLARSIIEFERLNWDEEENNFA